MKNVVNNISCFVLNSFLGENIVQGVIGGVVESVVEFVFKGLGGLPQKAANYFSKKSLKKTMQDSLEELNKSFNEDDKSKIVNYLAGKNNFTKLSKLSEKGSDFWKKVEKEELASIESVSFDDFSNIVFEKPSEYLPFPVKDYCERIFKIVRDYVFSIYYIDLSIQDRKLAKAICYNIKGELNNLEKTIKEENNKTKNELKSFIETIMQQHESGVLSSATKVKLAQKDPFLFVKLECPECHATGEYVLRRGDRAFCKKCGAKYDVIQNVDDLKDTIKEAEESIVEKLTKSDEGIKEEVSKLAREIVTVEYFNRYVEAQIATTSSDMQNIGTAVKDDIESLVKKECAEMNESLKGVSRQVNEIKDIISYSADKLDLFSDHIIKEIAQVEDDKMEEVVDKIHTYIGNIGDKVNLVYDGVESIKKELANKLSEENLNVVVEEIKKVFGTLAPRIMSDVLEKHDKSNRGKEEKFERPCPLCGKTASFTKRESNIQYKCPICGYLIPENEIRNQEYEAYIIKAALKNNVVRTSGENSFDKKNDPQYVILTMTKNPKGNIYGLDNCEILALKGNFSGEFEMNTSFNRAQKLKKIVLREDFYYKGILPAEGWTFDKDKKIIYKNIIYNKKEKK